MPVILLVAALDAGSAHAADWRYCLSAVYAEHKVYMTGPFATNEAMQTLQDKFANALDRAGLAHGAVQCPRGDAQGIAAMHMQAVRFNRESGNTVIEVDWKP